ncbi:hypothetical protein BOTBODRAFT_35144 [Botryobasidium botryosum FD-172 SS1]|uniref:FYVE-type domain-containing protein n=1 Tax=Botryobasidium botryosum (strain FD-172 SS1) TaxID=930990 RepID=A0A067MJG0_BOTB1|nr:hypothetical protein BOTBODRAFT_35144 [Botryobasidium botryosum FD-172 SS1]
MESPLPSSLPSPASVNVNYKPYHRHTRTTSSARTDISPRTPTVPVVRTLTPTPPVSVPTPPPRPASSQALSVPHSAPVSAAPSPPPKDAPSRTTPAPYRPGFQPKGVYRPRTDEFNAARSNLSQGRLVEERRLERRLEKLIDLHFSPDNLYDKKLANSRRSSSTFSLSDIASKNPGEIWRGVLESKRANSSNFDMRSAEQAVAHWQEDSAVSSCPICEASFHPLTNRKHHCRTCGRVVCSLPPRPPTRTQTCSLLITADYRTRRIEEVPDGIVDYGVSRKGADPKADKEREAYLRSIRLCRECYHIVSRQQHSLEATSVQPLTRFHSSLIRLEDEIKSSLPLFQELVLNLKNSETSMQHDAASARKRLLAAFSDYDTLAKKIRALPCAPGGSQDRIQHAIFIRANAFLQQNMFPLQALPKSPKPPTKGSSSLSVSSGISTPTPTQTPPPGRPIYAIDPDSALAHSLQPLLEQEALLETFIREAREQRKFEDARTLKTNLEELRVEISKVLAGAKIG